MSSVKASVLLTIMFVYGIAYAQAAWPGGKEPETPGSAYVLKSCAKGKQLSKDRKSCVPIKRDCPSGTRPSTDNTACISDECGPGMMPTVNGYCKVGV